MLGDLEPADYEAIHLALQFAEKHGNWQPEWHGQLIRTIRKMNLTATPIFQKLINQNEKQ